VDEDMVDHANSVTVLHEMTAREDVTAEIPTVGKNC
jgi:hypothetical protein